MIKIPNEIKALFKKDNVQKNIRIHFPNGEHEDITNENVIEESMAFTESICSSENLKFGLCEASVFQIETVGVGNIKDCTIEVSIEIQTDSGYYPIPLGTFVVESCTKQYNKNRRYVIAYTSEIQWDMLPNTLERAKTNGLIDLKYDSPYKFNVAAVAYANAYMGAADYFEDKSLCENAETYDGFYGHVFESAAMAKSPSGKQSTIKYYGRVYFESAYVPISSNEEADNLFWLNYQNASNIENFKTIYEEVCGNAQYEWKEAYTGLNLEEMMQALKYGHYNYMQYSHGGYGEKTLPLDNHRFVYPFMNYTKTEEAIYERTAYTSKTVIAVPYNARIVVWEASIDDSGKITGDVIFSETVNIRNAENIKFYTINNLPQMRMSFNRKLHKVGSNIGYRVDAKEIEVRNIVEAHSELNGFFGKNNRDGSIEFVKINASHCLYPSETLYPSEELFPNETNGGILSPTYYLDVWSEDNYTKPYGKVEVTYKNANEEEVYAYYSLVDEEADDYSADKYQTYSLSDNYLIDICTFTEEDINKILETVAESLKDVQYMPSEITLKGLPYVEAGDFISVLTKNDGFETYIMRRTMTGIKSLIDTFEATGEELCKNTTNATTRMERGS